jgi:tetratricopeptide (TPR) repeat protein
MRGRAVLAQMRAEYVVNSERWDCPCLRWDIDLTSVRARDAAVDLFAVGLSALKRGERARAERALADLVTLNGNRARPAPGQERDEVPDIVQLELQALLRQAGGARDEAVRLMREAAALEDRMPAEFGPPADVKPAHELFGEMLLEAGRAAQAQREFARALELAPKRALSLLGLGRAAAAAGDRATAAQAYRAVREIWHRADPGLPGFAEASRSVGAP